ncbi:MAG: hypothetical protein KC680_03435 [Candidatus Peregrinibacteria bacterium]|nr:hypothetical protein [Candidatus Peregrinibacteria bacterium]MCB9808335.1 hypothetical protein [Candidatus Peribacteria bacterium]
MAPDNIRHPSTSSLPRIESKDAHIQECLDLALGEIGLNADILNPLNGQGLYTVQDVLEKTREDLLDITNFGDKKLKRLYASLERIGFFREGRGPDGKSGFFPNYDPHGAGGET